MELLDVVTINSGNDDRGIKVLEDAIDYFPTQVYTIRYLGDVKRPYDGKLKLGGETHPFFFRDELIQTLRKYKSAHGLKNYLLAVTKIMIYYVITRFEKGRFVNFRMIARDFMGVGSVGVISLYLLDEDVSRKVAAHGFGHLEGLEHHSEPIDFMDKYLLLRPGEIGLNLCSECKDIIKKKQKI